MSDEDIILDEVVEEGRLVSLAEVKAMLEKADEGRDELTYEQKIALEHARRFARVDAKGAAGIVADVQKVVPGLEEKFAIKIADLVPQHPDDVMSILQKAPVEVTDDDARAIVDVVDKYYVA